MIIKKTDNNIRVRFAPSPTGELHLGSARTALYNYLFAQQLKGTMIFRVEDTDQQRYVPGAMDRFIEDLHWLGINWNEGSDRGGPHGPYIQSERTNFYREATERLLSSGAAYRCYCTIEQLEEMRQAQIARKEPPRYDRKCLRDKGLEIRDKNASSVVRLKIPEGETRFIDLIRGEVVVQNKEVDDQIILKSDGFPTYHLANVVDDHAMAITHVIRGEEWLPSTPKHLLLYQAFGWQPPQFAHLPLILAPDKKKFSKRIHGEAVWVATYRKHGYLPEALVNYLALLGWNPGDEREFFTLEELTKEFSLERVHKAGAIFDPEKLKFINAHYLRQLTNEAIVKQLRFGDFLSPDLSKLDNRLLARWVQITRDRMETLGEFDNLVWPMVKLADYPTDRLIFKKSDVERTTKGLAATHSLLTTSLDSDWQTIITLQTILERVVAETGLANGDIFWPVRVALSGLDASSAPAELLWVLGKEESLVRLEQALKKLA